MGNQQPKKINKVSKAQIDVGALKAKIHLQLMRDRKNGQVIKAQKQLINKVKAKSRNKTQQLLLAQRIVNGLKYAQACNQLMAYALSIRGQANFLAENINNPEKLAPWLPQIYSLIYAADMLGLSSLKEFKDLMRALNDPLAVNKYINPQIVELLKPTPSPQQMNIYFLQFSQRNNISLEQINFAGHKFTKDFKPASNPISKEDSFADLQNKLAQEFKKIDVNGNGQGQNQGWGGNGGYVHGQGQGGQGFNPNPNVPNYYDIDKNRAPAPKVEQNSNPYGIRQTYDPRMNNNPTTPTITPQPKIYDNTVPSKPQQKPREFNDSRISINSINDIDYFPEIQPMPKVNNDVEFDKICEILRAAM